MLFKKRIQVAPDLIAKYRDALVAGIDSAPDTEKSLYEVHLSSLEELQVALKEKDNVETVALQIWRERRNHGWSYLSGIEGSLVESRFHELATFVENQIFQIKGKDWYYSL